MFLINSNEQGEVVGGFQGLRGYDDFSRELNLRYHIGCITASLTSVANNTSLPASTNKFLTYQAIDFAGCINPYPYAGYLNTSGVIVAPVNQDYFTLGGATARTIQSTGDSTNRTGQNVICNYILARRLKQTTIPKIDFTIAITQGTVNTNQAVNNVSGTIKLKSVSPTGTITTLNTTNFTCTNTTVTKTEYKSVNLTNVSVNLDDVLYIEVSVTGDLSVTFSNGNSWFSSLSITNPINTDQSSHLYITQ